MNPKFYVEAYDTYYPGGGLGDLTGPFDTFEEAKEGFGGYHDSVTMLIVENNIIRRYADCMYKYNFNGNEMIPEWIIIPEETQT